MLSETGLRPATDVESREQRRWITLVEFRLTYDGPLPCESPDIRAIKHGIREQIHPQLKDLCARTPALEELARYLRSTAVRQTSNLGFSRPDYAAIGAKYRFGGFEFVPLVIGALHMVCHLDILFLRREKSGSLIVKPKDEYGGDLDNRLKVFLDALRAPREAGELPKGATPRQTSQSIAYSKMIL